MTEKTDYKKKYKELYNPSKKEPGIVTVPPFQFLMIDGVDARPESKGFQNAIQALFGISYKIKFSVKKSRGMDYAVMPLEGLWWARDMEDFIKGNKRNWEWTLMILQPDFITQKDFESAAVEAAKKDVSLPFGQLRLETFGEGPSAQIMHIGPFSEEHANILRLHELIRSSGGRFDGRSRKHHEIYLSDFRKTAPEKLKTVLRQPFVS